LPSTVVAKQTGFVLMLEVKMCIDHQKFPTNQSLTRPMAVFMEPFF